MRKIVLLVCALLCATISLYAASEDVAIEAPWGRISATLSQPTEGSDAAVLIVAGSGPTDRNGNSGLNLNTYAYKMLSDGLVKSGYAVLRYDKRAVGGSYLSPQDIPALTLDDYIEDAERCVAWLRAQGFARVYVAGHSEGGSIAIEVAERRRVAVDALVLLAAPGYPMDQILMGQLSAQLMPAYIGLYVTAQSIIGKIKSGVEVAVENIPQELLSLFHPTVQPFLRSSMQRDPCKMIAGCEVPILIITGGRDIQVSVANGTKLLAAAPDAQHVTFENMSHVLKDATSSDRVEQLLSVYTNSQQELTPGLVSTIVEFLNVK